LPADVYHGTRKLVGSEAAAGALIVVAPAELGGGDVWWVETPSNPRCEIIDIAAVSDEAHTRNVVVVVDSTFATPILQRPLDLGADLVLHSTTKFVSGHSDAMGGVLVTPGAATAEALRYRRMEDGATPGALDVWLTLRGVRTLPLRVERQSQSASEIAAWLATRVPVVWHPSLRDHPGHEIAARQMRGYGGVLSFEVESGERAAGVVDRLRLFRTATSLGGVESLAEWRRSVNPDAPEGLIRLSVGLEAPTDLIADLDRALA
jgi:cystathionine gamma-synthase